MTAVVQVTDQLGIEHFAAAFLPLAHEKLDGYFIFEHWPRAWYERYLTGNYFHVDPVVSAVRRSGRPIVWSQSLHVLNLSPKSRRIMDEARNFGLVDGVTIPLHSRHGIDGVFSVAGSRARLTQDEVTLLEIVATRAHGHLLDTENEPFQPVDDPVVTKTESQCLTLCAAGKTDREIAAIAGRSPRTIQAHIQNLQRKFGATNRAQLIAEAFRRGVQR